MRSINDVAEECGVSTATVSRILNGNPKGASEATRLRVRNAALRLGYQPSAVARGLRVQRMNTLGIVRGHPAENTLGPDPHFGAILDGVLAACREADQRTLLFSDDQWAKIDSRASRYCDGQCDGFILIIPPRDSILVATLLQRALPFVSVGCSLPGLECSYVAVDNVRVGHTATTYLLDAGHRRIAHLCGSDDHQSSPLRLQGYRRALEERDLVADESLILPGEYKEISGYDSTCRLMSRPERERPTALFCADDWIALGALRALKEMDIDVPQDVSVIGVNDGLEAASASPPLTTVRLPLRMTGKLATELLLSDIELSRGSGKEILLPIELIERATVCPRIA